ncbi:hypothetical protein L1887_25745 [Cichorium endivia]|nr:hypothetical protein L1887_25745 [Cichorium endivia]
MRVAIGSLDPDDYDKWRGQGDCGGPTDGSAERVEARGCGAGLGLTYAQYLITVVQISMLESLGNYFKYHCMSKSNKRKKFPESKKIVHTYNINVSPGDVVQGTIQSHGQQWMTNMEDSIASVEAILMYPFRDKKLLEEALTHSSYTESPPYQRLELLGDAILGAAITDFVFSAYPDVDPGQLSLLRAANISTEKLARVAVRNGLYKYVRHRTTVLNDKVREFVIAVEEEDEMVVHGGQMKAPKVLADIVESVAGAVYVDCGHDMKSMWMIMRGLLEPLVMLNVLEKQPQPITMLFEACQKEGKIVDIKHWRKGERNIASVYIDGVFIASGSSENKENAKLHAAEVALTRLQNTDAISLHNCNENTKTKGPKRKIHELCNRKRWPKATYRVEQELGPAHDRRYIASVQIELSDNILFMKGEEKSKVKDAENSAALMMFNALLELGY